MTVTYDRVQNFDVKRLIFRVEVVRQAGIFQNIVTEYQLGETNAVQSRLVAEDPQNIIFLNVNTAAAVESHHLGVVLDDRLR